MTEQSRSIGKNVEGVYTTRQDRSRRSRDAFIESGIVLLNEMRFDDLKVSELARHSGRSVGSFYKRFEDKEAFFRALRAAVVTRDRSIIATRLSQDRLETLSSEDAINEMVDTLADIFTSEVRGVLRESLLRILDPEDVWEPMRESGRQVQQRIVDRFRSEPSILSEEHTERKIRFCYQIIAGVLQNDLVNDFHIFSTKDTSIRIALKAALTDHMNSGSSY